MHFVYKFYRTLQVKAHLFYKPVYCVINQIMCILPVECTEIQWKCCHHCKYYVYSLKNCTNQINFRLVLFFHINLLLASPGGPECVHYHRLACPQPAEGGVASRYRADRGQSPVCDLGDSLASPHHKNHYITKWYTGPWTCMLCLE